MAMPMRDAVRFLELLEDARKRDAEAVRKASKARR
jgi:hypothetical protein